MLFRLQRYTFFLKRQNQLSEPTVMAPINIDGDTRRLMLRWLLSAFFSPGESVEMQAGFFTIILIEHR